MIMGHSWRCRRESGTKKKCWRVFLLSPHCGGLRCFKKGMPITEVCSVLHNLEDNTTRHKSTPRVASFFFFLLSSDMLQMFSHADCDCRACLTALKKRKRRGGRVFFRRRLQHYQYKQVWLCLRRPLIFHTPSRLVLICGFCSHIRFRCEASTFSNGSIFPLTF